ncbi:MAG TPA: DUF664 domain-containing protein [Jatrophihabitantaceae bacterium]|nr:DUF664 domain-containing protein [Jatrophihabitantaceae bacterium]
MRKRVPPLGAEKESLQASLDRHRDIVLWKLDGLDDEQLRRPMVPSGTNLIGLVKHLAMIEDTVRHSGHLDVVRELIDGGTGDHPDE